MKVIKLVEEFIIISASSHHSSESYRIYFYSHWAGKWDINRIPRKGAYSKGEMLTVYTIELSE